MPIIKSAKKAMKRAEVLRERNSYFKVRMKMALKHFMKSVEKKEKIGVDAVSTVYKAIDKCLKTGIIKKNTAARKKSRIAKLFAALQK